MKVDIFNTDKKYNIIYADPPWQYSDRHCNGNCEQHYPTMKLEEIAALPVRRIAEKDATLFMWATYPQMEVALDVIRAWGFVYKTIGFQWIKLNKSVQVNLLQITSLQDILRKSCFYGLGRWTRGNTECCLIATKGKPRRVSPKVSQLIFAPLTIHSAKPAETRDRIEELMGGGTPRIELFARQTVPGWDCWGNEV